MSNFVDKAKLALESLATLAKNVATGTAILVTEEEAKSRLLVCSTCPELENDQNQMQCKICSCFMRAKCQVNGARCPLNKW